MSIGNKMLLSREKRQQSGRWD